MYYFGDIIIINFPFSDGQQVKRRPAIVIKDTGDSDILIAKITSQTYNSPYDILIKDWEKSGLLSPSVIRIHKIQTVHHSLIFGQIGRLTSQDFKVAKSVLVSLVMSL